MGTRYRIYIGEASEHSVIALAARHFTGATVTRGVGLWEGEREPTNVVEVLDLSGDGLSFTVRAFAEAARVTFNQFAILVTYEPITGYLVEGSKHD